VPRRLGRRELLLGADLMIHPQATGAVHSVVIQAMANGVPVIAQHDPWLDFLIDGETAWVAPDAQPDTWRRLLGRAFEDRTALERLGDSARAWIRANRLAAVQVEKLLGLYREVLGKGYTFPPGGVDCAEPGRGASGSEAEADPEADKPAGTS